MQLPARPGGQTSQYWCSTLGRVPAGQSRHMPFSPAWFAGQYSHVTLAHDHCPSGQTAQTLSASSSGVPALVVPALVEPALVEPALAAQVLVMP